MDNLVTKFRTLKETISILSDKKSRLEGKKEQKLLELKERYGIMNKEEAERKVEELSERVNTQERDLQNRVEELEDIVEKA